MHESLLVPPLLPPLPDQLHHPLSAQERQLRQLRALELQVAAQVEPWTDRLAGGIDHINSVVFQLGSNVVNDRLLELYSIDRYVNPRRP